MDWNSTNSDFFYETQDEIPDFFSALGNLLPNQPTDPINALNQPKLQPKTSPKRSFEEAVKDTCKPIKRKRKIATSRSSPKQKVLKKQKITREEGEPIPPINCYQRYFKHQTQKIEQELGHKLGLSEYSKIIGARVVYHANRLVAE